MNEAWFFIGIFVFIFVVWIVIGGPTRGVHFDTPSLAGFSLNSSAAAGGTGGNGTSSSSFFGSTILPRVPYALGDTQTYLTAPTANGPLSLGFWGSSSAGNPSSGVTPSLSGIAYGTPSPYNGIVTMDHYVSGAASKDAGNEYVTIHVNSESGTPVDITGWTLESEATGAASTIPQGTELPRSGIINAAQDIVLLPGESATIVSGVSPIGASFKENKCIGYFSQFQTFYPSLSDACPDPTTELETYYQGSYVRDASCIDYVNTLSRCSAVLSPPTTLSGVCQSFLVKYLNYNGCVNAHQNDADFSGNTWHVYLGRSNALFRSDNEVVKLLDRSGKTVDAFTY